MAFPTPAAGGYPEAPAPARSSSNRSLLLGLAGIIGIASVAAIGFAMRGRNANHAVVFDNTAPSAAPATSLAPAAVGDDSAPPAASGSASSDIPPLSGTPGSKARPATATTHAPGTASSAPRPEHSAEPAAQPSAVQPPPLATGFPTALPTTFPTVLPTAAPTTTSAPVAKYDGIECQKARLFKSLNRPKEAQSWGLACIAKGGSP
jgi:hypothetical protein